MDRLFRSSSPRPHSLGGRTFSGLLGLSAYSDLRQALAGLVNTRAFNNHFGTTAHAQNKTREERTAGELSAAIAKDYEILVGAVT